MCILVVFSVEVLCTRNVLNSSSTYDVEKKLTMVYSVVYTQQWLPECPIHLHKFFLLYHHKLFAVGHSTNRFFLPAGCRHWRLKLVMFYVLHEAKDICVNDIQK